MKQQHGRASPLQHQQGSGGNPFSSSMEPVVAQQLSSAARSMVQPPFARHVAGVGVFSGDGVTSGSSSSPNKQREKTPPSPALAVLFQEGGASSSAAGGGAMSAGGGDNLVSAGTIRNPFTGEIMETYEEELPPPQGDWSVPRSQYARTSPRLIALLGEDPQRPREPRREILSNEPEHDSGRTVFGDAEIADRRRAALDALLARDLYFNRTGDTTGVESVRDNTPSGYLGHTPVVRIVPTVPHTTRDEVGDTKGYMPSGGADERVYAARPIDADPSNLAPSRRADYEHLAAEYNMAAAAAAAGGAGGGGGPLVPGDATLLDTERSSYGEKSLTEGAGGNTESAGAPVRSSFGGGGGSSIRLTMRALSEGKDPTAYGNPAVFSGDTTGGGGPFVAAAAAARSQREARALRGTSPDPFLSLVLGGSAAGGGREGGTGVFVGVAGNSQLKETLRAYAQTISPALRPDLSFAAGPAGKSSSQQEELRRRGEVLVRVIRGGGSGSGDGPSSSTFVGGGSASDGGLRADLKALGAEGGAFRIVGGSGGGTVAGGGGGGILTPEFHDGVRAVLKSMRVSSRGGVIMAAAAAMDGSGSGAGIVAGTDSGGGLRSTLKTLGAEGGAPQFGRGTAAGGGGGGIVAGADSGGGLRVSLKALGAEGGAPQFGSGGIAVGGNGGGIVAGADSGEGLRAALKALGAEGGAPQFGRGSGIAAGGGGNLVAGTDSGGGLRSVLKALGAEGLMTRFGSGGGSGSGSGDGSGGRAPAGAANGVRAIIKSLGAEGGATRFLSLGAAAVGGEGGARAAAGANEGVRAIIKTLCAERAWRQGLLGDGGQGGGGIHRGTVESSQKLHAGTKREHYEGAGAALAVSGRASFQSSSAAASPGAQDPAKLPKSSGIWDNDYRFQGGMVPDSFGTTVYTAPQGDRERDGRRRGAGANEELTMTTKGMFPVGGVGGGRRSLPPPVSDAGARLSSRKNEIPFPLITAAAM